MSKHIISKRVCSHRAPQRQLRRVNREHPSQMAACVYLATRECYIVFMMCLINHKRIGPFTNCMTLTSVPCPPEIRNSLRHNPVLRGPSTALLFHIPSIIFLTILQQFHHCTLPLSFLYLLVFLWTVTMETPKHKEHGFSVLKRRYFANLHHPHTHQKCTQQTIKLSIEHVNSTSMSIASIIGWERSYQILFSVKSGLRCFHYNINK